MRAFPLVLCLLALSLSTASAQETMAGFLVEDYSCITCHTDMRVSFLEGVHSRRGIQCTDCHGGDPGRFEIATAHSEPFSGAPDKTGAVGLCLSCHGDVPQMRQFALEPVTRDMYLVSRHGQALLQEGDSLAPSCGDCHGSHAIFPRTDPRSPVNPTRISETCSACHSDPARVPEGMETDQFQDWVESAHGRALLIRHNERSANCASCHGSHSALPPGVREIPNVCGKCHQMVREAYFQGPHGLTEGGAESGIACTGCHDNHHTEMLPLAEIGTLCLGCHEAQSHAATAGLELQEQVLRTETAGHRAREDVQSLREAGERTEDEEIRLLQVETHLQELLIKAHTLDPLAVDELARQTSTISTLIGERAESVGEHRWERKLLAIPIWLLMLGGILLALRKRRVIVLQAEAEPGVEEGTGGS
ncbi:cytochrome c3 family protein [Gemmatimonadota bacterium]